MSVSILEIASIIEVLEKNLSLDFLKGMDHNSVLSKNICQNRDKIKECLEKLKILQEKFKDSKDPLFLQQNSESYEGEIQKIEQYLISELIIIKTEARKKLALFNKVTGFNLENEEDLKPKKGPDTVKSRLYVTLPSNIQNWLVLITAVETRLALLKTRPEERSTYARKRDTLIDDTLNFYLHNLIEYLTDSSSARRTSGLKALFSAGIDGTEHWGDSAPPSKAPSPRVMPAREVSQKSKTVVSDSGSGSDSDILKLHSELHKHKSEKPHVEGPKKIKHFVITNPLDLKQKSSSEDARAAITHTAKDCVKDKAHFGKEERDIAVLFGAAIPSDSSTAPTPRNVGTPMGADWEKQLAEALEKTLNASLSIATGSKSSRNSISVSVHSSRHNSISLLSGFSSKRSSISVSISASASVSACPSVRNSSGPATHTRSAHNIAKSRGPQHFRFSISAPTVSGLKRESAILSGVQDESSKIPDKISDNISDKIPYNEFEGEFYSDLHNLDNLENLAVDLELDQDTTSDIEAALDAIPDFSGDESAGALHSPFTDAISKEVLNRLRAATLTARKHSQGANADDRVEGIELAQLTINPRSPEVLFYRKLHNRSEQSSNSEPSSPVHSPLPLRDPAPESMPDSIPVPFPTPAPLADLVKEPLPTDLMQGARKKIAERRKSL